MAILFTPGQVVATPDWDALGQQHGGVTSTQVRAPSAEEKAAATKAAAAAAPLGDNEEPDPQDPRTWYIRYETNPIHRYYFADGSYVEARTAPNGADFQVVEYKPSAKFTATQTATQQGAAEWHTEGTPDGQGGYDNSRPIMVRTVNGQRQTRALTSAELKDWNEAQQRGRNPGGKTDAEIKQEQDAAVTASIGKPTGNTRSRSAAGKTTKETEYVLPDGTTVWRTSTAEEMPDQVGKPTGNSRQRTEGGQTIKETEYVLPDGTTVWRAATTEAENQFPTEPAGAPAAALNYGMVTESLAKYRDFLNQQVQAGTLKPEDATKLMAARLAQAKLAMEEQQNVVSAQTGMFGQQVTQRGQSLTETQSRRTQAMGVYNGVLGAFLPMLKYMPKGGGQAMADLMMAAMSYGKAMATDWGGMREVPEIAYGPAAAEARRTGMPGGPSSVPSPEAAGSFLQQGQAADVEAAKQATQAQIRAALGAPGVGPGAQAAPIFRPPPPVTGSVGIPGAPINPPMGEPGNDSTQPVGMAPPAPGSFMAAYNRPPQAPGMLGTMLGDDWMPNTIVAKAYQDVFGVPFNPVG